MASWFEKFLPRLASSELVVAGTKLRTDFVGFFFTVDTISYRTYLETRTAGKFDLLIKNERVH
jgi:hypothetical protein